MNLITSNHEILTPNQSSIIAIVSLIIGIISLFIGIISLLWSLWLAEKPNRINLENKRKALMMHFNSLVLFMEKWVDKFEWITKGTNFENVFSDKFVETISPIEEKKILNNVNEYYIVRERIHDEIELNISMIRTEFNLMEVIDENLNYSHEKLLSFLTKFEKIASPEFIEKFFKEKNVQDLKLQDSFRKDCSSFMNMFNENARTNIKTEVTRFIFIMIFGFYYDYLEKKFIYLKPIYNEKQMKKWFMELKETQDEQGLIDFANESVKIHLRLIGKNINDELEKEVYSIKEQILSKFDIKLEAKDEN